MLFSIQRVALTYPLCTCGVIVDVYFVFLSTGSLRIAVILCFPAASKHVYLSVGGGLGQGGPHKGA
jgi:hypothetical protein